MNPNPLTIALLCNQAQHLYQLGQPQRAADLFTQAAEQALAAGLIDIHVQCLRWTGNSYLWAFQHEQACLHLLQAASYWEHPEAVPSDIYTALTDLCLLAIRCRPLAQIHDFLTQARVFLERRGRRHWGHRVDRLEAMLHLSRGDFRQAHEMASRGWDGMLAAADGPRYQKGAYLDALFRAAHGLGNVEEMDRALELFRDAGESFIVTSQVRELVCQAMRHAFDGVTHQNRDLICHLAEDALVAIRGALSPFDETADVLRLLLLAGEVDAAAAGLAENPPPASVVMSLLRCDVRLAQVKEFAGWSPPYFHRHFGQARPVGACPPPSPEVAGELRQLLAAAAESAQAEDQRLECQVNAPAVRLRQDWLELLSPLPACAVAA